MSNILIINGAKKFAHSNGQLNDTLTEVADGYLRDAGHDVKIVRAESDYDVQQEVQNFLWADVWLSGKCRAGGWARRGP
ncbi:Modulator of drug activity B [Raoultella planticola]|uniref:Modulator of drug activity B n=1 Tax=Raoultella planticola TaxID=575 RepID=A0A485BYN6_RAOPL|nr:Modulator of drug activity B [Raoultella planticola]